MAEIKKYLHTLDIGNNKIINLLLNPLSTSDRTTVGSSLTTADEGYVCYDTDENVQYFWDGTTWIASGGGGNQTLQDVTDLGNTTTNNIQLLNAAETIYGAGGGILLDNGSRLREGTIDAGLGGSKGIAQICAVGYELKWEAGRLYVMNGNGNSIRQSLYNFTTTPAVTDDSSLGYAVGSLWTLDDGTVYECADATIGAAVWNLVNTGTTPNLQQVTDVDNNTTNDIILNGGYLGRKIGGAFASNYFFSNIRPDNARRGIINIGDDSFKDSTIDGVIAIGVSAARNIISGNSIIAIGDGTLGNSTGNQNIAIGLESGTAVSGSSNILIGYRSGWVNSGNYVTAIGLLAGYNGSAGNTFSYINLIGLNASATADGQVVFSKDGTIMERLGTDLLTASRLHKFPNADGTFALSVNGVSAGTDGSITIPVGTGTVTDVTATSPITSSGGTAPVISTSMATNKLIGRSTASVGVMEEISIGSGLSLSSGTLSATFTSPLTTKGDLFTYNTGNTRLPLGSNTQILTVDTSTPTGMKWAAPPTATPTGYYLAISDSTTQDNPTANIPRAVKFNTTDLFNGFSLQTETAVFTGTINNGGAGAGTILNVTGVTSGTLKVGMVLTGGSITTGTFISAFTSGTGGIGTYQVSVSQNRASATYTGTMTSQIVVANTGIYNIQFSSQMDKTDAGVDYVNFWLRRNGADITASAGVISLQGNSPAYMMAAWNYLIELIAGDIIELYWASADTGMSIISETAQTSPFAHPAVQSTILSITQQSGIMAGTGITGLGISGNIQTGATQTLATGTSGTAFNISSSSNIQTFNIPLASTASVTAGLISKTDYDTFNGKLTSSLTSTNIFVGNGSNVATGVALGGDGSLSNTGSLTVTGLRGVALPALGASAGLLKYTGTGTNTWVFDTTTYATDSLVVHLAGTETITGAKTFLNTTLLLRNVANTFNGSFTNTNTADRIYTLPNLDTTIAGLAVGISGTPQAFTGYNSFSALTTMTNNTLSENVLTLNTTRTQTATVVDRVLRISNNWSTGTSNTPQNISLDIQNTNTINSANGSGAGVITQLHLNAGGTTTISSTAIANNYGIAEFSPTFLDSNPGNNSVYNLMRINPTVTLTVSGSSMSTFNGLRVNPTINSSGAGPRYLFNSNGILSAFTVGSSYESVTHQSFNSSPNIANGLNLSLTGFSHNPTIGAGTVTYHRAFWNTTGDNYFNTTSGSTRINGITGFGVLSAVSGTPVATPSISGGTLSAGTYYYKIVVADGFGNTTLSSTEVSATTTGGSSSVALSWTAVTNAVSYRIYRGTATNTQTLYYTSTTNSYTDTNAASSAGTVPLFNTTYLVQAGNSGTYKLDVFGTTRLTGILAFDTSPSAWSSSFPSLIQLGTGSFTSLTANNITYIGNNTFFSAAWKYQTTNPSARIEIQDGFKFYIAPSGTAGTNITFSQPLTINSSGNVLIGTTSDVTSAILQVTSTTKGFLPPRTLRASVSSPVAGLVIYATDLNKLCVYNGTAWEVITSV